MEKYPAALDTGERVRIMKLGVRIGSKLNPKGKYQRRGNNRCTDWPSPIAKHLEVARGGPSVG